MRRNAGKSRFSALGYLIFFVTIAAMISCAVLIFEFVSERGSRGTVAGVMFAVIAVLAALCTLIDFVRRKYMVERPVKRILSATGRIAHGDFTVREQPLHAYGRYDEYDLILQDLNVMAAELGKNEMLKTDFVASVSHELKTPLSIIQSYAAALQAAELPEATRAEYAATLAAAAKRLSELVTNILKLNKLENQEILPEKRRVDAGESLSSAVLNCEELIERKGIALNCDIEDAEIFSDESLLEIIWNNLLSNAIKFTPPGGSISVSLREAEGFMEARVSDTGCGISTEAGARIFDKFYQGDPSHAQEGNGLGLALVKKVMDILGGEITVESAPGAGSTFTVRLKKEAQ